MSYERDTNRSTGVGAIAARDAVNPRLGRRRAARARVMDRRDRARAGLTFGPGGGLSGFSGLGAIDTGKDTRPTSPVRQTDIGGGGRGSGGVVVRPPVVTTTFNTANRSVISTGTFQSAPLVKVFTPVVDTPPIVVTDPGGSVVVPPPKSSGGGGVITGGGGGGGSVFQPDPKPPQSFPEAPDPIDIPPETPGMDRNKMLLIGAAAAAAAYFLFFRKKKGTTTPP